MGGKYSGHTDSAGSGYNSQIGLHGLVFSVFNKALSLLGLDAEARIRFMRIAVAAVFAGALSFVLLVLFKDVGGSAVLFAVVGTMVSKWTVAYATNL